MLAVELQSVGRDQNTKISKFYRKYFISCYLLQYWERSSGGVTTLSSRGAVSVEQPIDMQIFCKNLKS